MVCVMDGILTDRLNALLQCRYHSFNEEQMTTLCRMIYELKLGLRGATGIIMAPSYFVVKSLAGQMESMVCIEPMMH